MTHGPKSLNGQSHVETGKEADVIIVVNKHDMEHICSSDNFIKSKEFAESKDLTIKVIDSFKVKNYINKTENDIVMLFWSKNIVYRDYYIHLMWRNMLYPCFNSNNSEYCLLKERFKNFKYMKATCSTGDRNIFLTAIRIPIQFDVERSLSMCNKMNTYIEKEYEMGSLRT